MWQTVVALARGINQCVGSNSLRQSATARSSCMHQQDHAPTKSSLACLIGVLCLVQMTETGPRLGWSDPRTHSLTRNAIDRGIHPFRLSCRLLITLALPGILEPADL